MSGAAGSNECPAGSLRIETVAECHTAATVVGKDARQVAYNDYSYVFPRGCYYNTNGGSVKLNAHPVGAGDSRYELLCAAVTHRCATTRTKRSTYMAVKDRDG